MNLSHTTLGPFKLFSIETGRFALDGGAMFGVVPKTLWSRFIVPDDSNRITMAMRCLLVHSENTGRVYLIDDGIGNKFDEKFRNIYKIDQNHSSLETSLNYHGYSFSDITDLILTHLHFDHCGGTTQFGHTGNLPEIIFPNADIWITEAQWENASHPNAREKASFLAENIEPLKQSTRVKLVDGFHTYEEGLTTIIANGHSIGQQLPVIHSGNQTVVFVADLLPTAVHIPLPWVMGYDMQPLVTLDEKAEFLHNCVEKGWSVFLEHDANNEVVTIKKENGRFSLDRSFTLSELVNG